MKTFSTLIVLASLATIALSHTVTFDHFWTLDEIDEYLEDLLVDFPQLISVETAGTTSEGRDIKAYKVSNGGSNAKNVIAVESGLRPREWLATMSVLYMIHEIVEHDYEFVDLLANVDFVFIPVSNPDGYAFSFTAGNRNWNKNRRSVGSGCFGVDINRNFEYQFLAGSNPCDDNFAGTNFASEPETRAIDTILRRYRSNLRMFISVQTGGSQILYPYSAYTFASIEEPQFRAVGNAVNAAMPTSYAIGAAGVVNGVERGTLLDYAYYNDNVPYPFVWRLPSGPSNSWDFPVAQLTRTLSEVFNGFLVFADRTATLR